jgi:hypothetical protein
MTNEEYNARLDALAAMAMQGYLADYENHKYYGESSIPIRAYRLAEKMMTERTNYIKGPTS